MLKKDPFSTLKIRKRIGYRTFVRKPTIASCPLSIDELRKMNSIDRMLILAAAANNVEEVSRLVSVGADVNAKHRLGDTPLHRASYHGHSQVVIELLDRGADIDLKSFGGDTPLHCACLLGYLAVFNELSSRGADIEAKDNEGNTPLHLAGMNGRVAIVKALLAVGADILAANDYGTFPIHKAVFARQSEASKCLLQHFYATMCGWLSVHELLEDLTWIPSPPSVTLDVPPLRLALDRNVLGTDDVVEILEYLVDRNPAWISSRDQDGSLPLHVACRRGAPFTILQSLVNLYKASVKSVTPQGDLPLFLACETPEPSLGTIFLLIKLYPDVLVYR
jgi:ankyrin repeat protein